ncbi:MAG: RIP metalloprotease RseP [Nitrospirota bacterium]
MAFLSAIILLGILIFVHEFGHFLFAKLLGVRILKFSLGFGPKLISKKHRDTEYLISSIPLGGYVKMLGEEPGEELKEDEKPMAYNYQPVWKRVIIVFSGPLFNIFFATFIFVMIFLYGVPVLLPEIGEVSEQSPAELSGLMKDDIILEINGASINQWGEMTEIIHRNPGNPLSFKIKRGSDIIAVTITPELKRLKDIFGEEKSVGLIGIRPSGKTFTKKEGPVNAISNSIQRTWDVSVLTVVSIIKLIQRIIPAETIGGPILILQMAGEQASHGILNFFTFMAVISINLGILNLLPIPVLDGGHIFFLGIEAIRRKPLSERFVVIAQRVGLAIILFIMAFALYNDIVRLITGKQFIQ